MKLEIPYVEIDDDLKEIVGSPDPGTRFYKKEGTEEDFSKWQEALLRIGFLHGNYSPVSVANFVQVSRAAVHKRLREGRLTGFLFQKVKDGSDTDKPLMLDGSPACFVPVIECMAWKDIKGGCTSEDLEKYKRMQKVTPETMDLFFGREDGNDALSKLLKSKGGESDE